MASKKQDQVPQIEPASQSLIDKPAKPERQTKQALLLGLISREDGATLEELTSATGWLPHTARASLTGLRKRGYDIERQRIAKVSRYFVRITSK